jgi:hypothetical protein
MNKNTQKMLMGAAIAGMVGMATASSAFAFDCVGGNTCSNKSACKTATSTKHKNSCKGQGMVKTKDEAACTALKEKNGAPAAGEKNESGDKKE